VPVQLQRVPFLPEDIRAVAGFSCGEAPWEQELNDWITGKAADGIRAHVSAGGDAWLYVTEQDGVVGFASLARSNWRWPGNRDRPRRLTIIPALGVRDDLKGKPDDAPPEERYSAQILRDLIGEAVARFSQYSAEGLDPTPILALFVHPENVRAIRFYERAGFQHFFRTYTDPVTGVTYRSMVLRLPIDD
jgi:GNAT superfamily N-acetyltransferase